MNIDIRSLYEIKEKIEYKLLDIPEGEKIDLPRDLLEILLFQKAITKEKIEAKFLIWSGSFLRHINLENVSFDGLVLDMEKYASTKYFDEKEIRRVEEILEYKSSNGLYNVDLSNTNAKIDIEKSFDYIYQTLNNEKVRLVKYNLENTDLSFSNIDKCDEIFNSNLSNTNANIFGDGHITRCIISKLNQNDYSSQTVSASAFNDKKIFINSHFCDTSLNIVCDKLDCKEDIEAVLEHIKYGYLDGCNVNGELLPNSKKRIEKEIKNLTYQIVAEDNSLKRKR